MPIQLFELTHSTLQVALLYLTTLGPLLIAPIVGGAVADAVDRRTMLLIAEGGFALVSVGLAINASLPDPHVWALYVLDFAGTAVFSFGTPALRSLLPRIVREEKIVAASSLDSLASNFNAVAGPAAGGLVIAALGFTGTYLLDVASFSASLVSIWLLPKLPAAHDAEAPSLRSIVEGFRFVEGAVDDHRPERRGWREKGIRYAGRCGERMPMISSFCRQSERKSARAVPRARPRARNAASNGV